MCPGSVNRDTAVFQSVEKDEATQAIICTILSASNTSLWRFLLRGFYRGAGGQGETWRSFRKLEKSGMEKMGRDSSVWCSMLFFPWRIMGLLQGCHSSNDSVFACAHGDCECLRLDACAGFMERMELALWNCE